MAHNLEHISLGIGNFLCVDVDLIVGFRCLYIENIHCALLHCHIIITYIVENGSTPIFVTFNEVFIVVMILLPKIL